MTLAVGDYDDSTYLSDVATRRVTATLTDRGGSQVGLVAFSPDSKTLAVVDDRGGIYLWNVGTGHLIATLKGGPEGSTASPSLAFSPDGKLVAAGGPDDHKTNVWEVATGQLAATLSDPTGQNGDVGSLAFSPDGKLLAVSDLNTYLWDVATRHIVATVTNPQKHRRPRCRWCSVLMASCWLSATVTADSTRFTCGASAELPTALLTV
jgi:WD40 repeat protein